jgi:hypothetical protein
MTNRNRRLRWIAAALVALALLAVVAWRQRPETLRIGSAQSTVAKIAMPESPSREATTTPARNDASGSDSRSEGNDASATCYREYRRNLRDYRDRLGSARNADEAVDRLMLDILAADGSKEAFDAYGREFRVARQRWPDDLELSWLGLGHCGKGCDHDAEVRHLLSIDPDNAAAWMAAMSAARSDHDEAGFAQALQRAASAKIYDSRMGVVFLHARTMLARVPVPDSCLTPQSLADLRRDVGREPTNDDRIDIMAFALESAFATTGFQGLSKCAARPGMPPLPEAQRRQCIALLSRVAKEGDTLLEQQAATSWLLGLETDPARLAQLRERYRQLRWLQTVSFGKPLPEHYATRVWSQGEVDTMQGIAIERGLWPPPPGWLPDDPRARALILGEPPPWG